MARVLNAREAHKVVLRHRVMFGRFETLRWTGGNVTAAKLQKQWDEHSAKNQAAADFIEMLRNIGRVDRDEAVATLDEALRAGGVEFIHVSKEVPIHSIADATREVLEANASAGKVAASVVEGAPIEDRIDAARRNLQEAHEAVHALEQLVPQPSFAAVAP